MTPDHHFAAFAIYEGILGACGIALPIVAMFVARNDRRNRERAESE